MGILIGLKAISMRGAQWSTFSFVLLLCLCAVPPAVFQTSAAQENAARAEPSASDQQKRQNAVALFSQGKRLEALPLLEELAQKNPQDAELLVDLGASLIERAATLTDQDAAAKERLRARDLLQKAWELGDASPLGENLRQLLRELAASAAIRFSENPAVERVMS